MNNIHILYKEENLFLQEGRGRGRVRGKEREKEKQLCIVLYVGMGDGERYTFGQSNNYPAN